MYKSCILSTNASFLVVNPDGNFKQLWRWNHLSFGGGTLLMVFAFEKN